MPCTDVTLIELLGDESFVKQPYAVYDHLRERPGWESPSGYRVFARYQDVLAVLRDPETFGQEGRSEPTFSRKNPPEHTRLRRLVARAFTPKSVARQHQFIDDLVNSLLSPLIGHGSMDLIADFARPLPAAVITRMLGVPNEDRGTWEPWLNAIGESRGV